jgi:hypothetical protein
VDRTADATFSEKLMEEALIGRLLVAPGVAAMVEERVFPGSRPQGSALPAVVFSLVDGAPLYADEGEVGIAQARIQIDCWADSYAGAKTLARAVKACLSDFVGEAGGTQFLSIFIDAERDLREGGSGAADYPFRTSIDFTVWHRT